VDTDSAKTTKFADVFAAMGSEPRLAIVRLLLSAHPDGMFAGEVQSELGISASTLSHHLEKLRNEELVTVTREGTYLRYRANAETLRELLSFLYAECCTRTQAVKPAEIITISQKERPNQ
jgi:ArsR family transcriptional regulator, arsenate/arsenite/antimonite-responsive transcriptional repressor